MPYFKLSEVAQRMDANESWLRNRINEDRRSSNPQPTNPGLRTLVPVRLFVTAVCVLWPAMRKSAMGAPRRGVARHNSASGAA